ncbi:MAG: hypothetical protein B7Y39_11520 [Bdellovibrio sp. 28-41-41]|nr:MAG: hypothetical protein B7Y39_11520 [Bdellovibrio sp. 28-41-41]
MSSALVFAETFGLGFARGCGGKATTFWAKLLAVPYLARKKEPKYPQTNKITKKEKNMNKQKFSNSTRKLLIQLPLIILMLALTFQMLLTGCANSPRRNDSIHAILAKENELIEKLKVERSEENLRQVIEQNELLKKSEAHLLMSLAEMLNANRVVMTKIINPTKQEAKNGKDERTRD